jgi:hypothetical protein
VQHDAVWFFNSVFLCGFVFLGFVGFVVGRVESGGAWCVFVVCLFENKRDDDDELCARAQQAKEGTATSPHPHTHPNKQKTKKTDRVPRLRRSPASSSLTV